MGNPNEMAHTGDAVHAAAERCADILNALSQAGDPRAAIEAVLRAHMEPEPVELAADDVAGLRKAAAELLPVFEAASTTEAADRINQLMDGNAHPPRLSSHGDTTGWHLHVDSSDDASWGEWFLASSALALAILLTVKQQPPAGLCASPSCRRPFANTGRGSPRRYCSPACGTRERVAAYRAAKSG